MGGEGQSGRREARRQRVEGAGRPGQSRSRRLLRRGAGRERRSLEPGCWRGSAASVRASAALHGARLPLASAPARCCCRRRRRCRGRKSQARGTRHKETVAVTTADWAAAQRQLRTAPSAVFKGAAPAPPRPRALRPARASAPACRTVAAGAGPGRSGGRIGAGRAARAPAARGARPAGRPPTRKEHSPSACLWLPRFPL